MTRNSEPSGNSDSLGKSEPSGLSTEALEFLEERHLGSLTLVRPDGSPHVTPIGFTWDERRGVARIITFAGSKKVRLLDASGSLPAAICQVDGGRWITLEGTASVSKDPEVNRDAEARYAARYRPPADRGSDRRTIIVTVESFLGRR